MYNNYQANVLIDHEQHAKICDFGSSYAVGECPGSCPARPPEDTQALATHIYLSPEIWDLEEQTSYRSDIWALGCLLFEVQTGKRVYDGKTDKQTMYNMTIKELPPATIEKFPSDDFSQALGQVAIGCLSPDPQDRLTSQQVLQKLNEINTVEI
ncbi:serine/threonine protein kinase [Ceratobasidium sp. 395]|nr:serine/threonine protein kinase [Ceratobasidium sp. 395]